MIYQLVTTGTCDTSCEKQAKQTQKMTKACLEDIQRRVPSPFSLNKKLQLFYTSALRLIEEEQLDACYDVGCDHGYFILSLAQAKKQGLSCLNAVRLVGSDVSASSLKKAQAHAESLQLQSHVDLRTAFGLPEVLEGRNLIVLAGMGAEEMIDILLALQENRADLTGPANRNYYFVQATKSLALLRCFLWQNKYTLLEEFSLEDKGKLYTCFFFHDAEVQEVDASWDVQGKRLIGEYILNQCSPRVIESFFTGSSFKFLYAEKDALALKVPKSTWGNTRNGQGEQGETFTSLVPQVFHQHFENQKTKARYLQQVENYMQGLVQSSMKEASLDRASKTSDRHARCGREEKQEIARQAWKQILYEAWTKARRCACEGREDRRPTIP